MAYKPYKSKYAIVFEERQIQSLQINLNVNFANSILSSRGNAVSGDIFETPSNSCRVTISDPYLDGVAWTTLNEINSLTGLATKADMDGLSGKLKRKCEPGESPADGCFPYAIIDTEENSNSRGVTGRLHPVLILTLWYKLGGSTNQTIESTYYFDVMATSIKHGGSEPTVTISGKNAFETRFQQNLQPTFFDQGKNWVDEFNTKLFKPEGFVVEDVCSDSAEEVKMDRVYKVSNLTPLEILNKFVSSKPGSQVLSLPTKEMANKIQICTKEDHPCYGGGVFYLGKGLYEQYNIKTEIPKSSLTRNIRLGGENIEGPKGDETKYTVSIPDPEATKKQLKDVSAEAFSAFNGQFANVSDYATPFVWKGTGNDKELKIEKLENVAKFGDAKSSSAYFGGVVLNANNEEKTVVVKSKFFVQYCNSEGVCNRGTLYQEYRKLKSVSVKETDAIAINGSVGEIESSDPQKKSKTRFYITLTTGEEITLEPSSIKAMISTSEKTSDKAKEEEAPSDNSDVGSKIGEIGSTGYSTGPHIHAEWLDKRSINETHVRRYVDIKGSVSLSQNGGYRIPSRPNHFGVDLGGAEGIELFVTGGASIIGAGATNCVKGDKGCGDGYGNYVDIRTPEGDMRIAHLREGSIPSSVPNATGSGERSSSSAGRARNGNIGISSDRDAIQIDTEFKGVPKALRILPGRTILSFVSNYDQWITSGKSNTIEPDVWIPEKYRSWYIGKVEYNWDRGDLRVKISAFLPWLYQDGQTIISVPTWQKHKETKGYVDYYDYIRSAGDLCFTNNNGEDSCKICAKQRLEASQTSSASSVNNTYSKGKFTYTGNNQSAVQSLLNAAEAAGVKSNIGQAAIVGNAQKESFARLDPTASGDTGASLGVFQWQGSRRTELEDFARQLGTSPTDRETQMKFFVKEVKRYPDLINYLNRNDITLEQAVIKFGGDYLRPGNPVYPDRTRFAQTVLDNMK